MQLNLMKVLNEPGSSFEVTKTLDMSALVVEEGVNSFPKGAAVFVELKNILECVTIFIRCEFAYATSCARCLKEVTVPMEFEFNSIVKVDDEDQIVLDDDAIIIDASNMLDAKELIEGLILMNLPLKQLCNESCKGLCQKCGKDLNEDECKCEKREIDPRFAKLSQLLD